MYLTETSGAKKEVEEDSYLVTYTKHLERKIRALETEKQLIDAERIRLEREVHAIRTELERMRQTPLIAATVVDVLEDGRVIVKSSTGPHFVVQAYSGLGASKIVPGARVALNQRTFSLVEVLPPTRDPFVRAMEVEEAPQVTYDDIGGLKEQIREIRETVELPLLKPELFKKVGIDPPKGVLLYGPPGTGKTMVARAVAHETKTTFIRVISSELVQKFIGEGARLVRDIFNMAREKAPSIVFIDEIDAVGSKRMDLATSGDREVQRTLMQLLSELDGFDARGDVRIIAATNRPDILDPALLRPGRFDRMIEFPLPDAEARVDIFRIHTRRMNLDESVCFAELVKKTDGATGADIKAICTEAGMFAIRELRDIVTMEDFLKAIDKIMGKEESNGFNPQLYG
ncbi:MAG: proteasome-activating nucleotidase [Candidatus Odinarchaeum yellowstonii]|uniref:Proteasome-activating nucleotidase n=1 Tax=Odinarchaeota yellowstonii (strain LCB_4) TaxID=1841599 RepID=A0AAF0D3M2_ODILC|nr:MAG: proteasome-activating nucleotidase [Candidatus Odinarchaeum yellowstonii]